MSGFKVAVYAICKNEEKFVEKWVESMSEADAIYVLDTGSTDNTVKKLKEKGVIVKTQIVQPWRFDVARNLSLDMLPDDIDICVCTDLDEVLHKGWREKVENTWSADTSKLQYRYTWSFNDDGTEGGVFWISKIHNRHDFIWKYPVHEVLEYIGKGPFIEKSCIGLQLDHFPDKNKSRGQYIGLLEMAVEENPDDDRCMHYLGREYMYYGMWSKCREVLKKHLELKSSKWKEERSASMRFIARSCKNLNLFDEEEEWLFKAIAEAPKLREPWVEAADMEYRKNNWLGSLFFAERALEITVLPKAYINEAVSWGSKPYDLAAIAAYNLGLYDKALEYGEKALQIEPQNKRLKDNLIFYKNKVD